MLQSHNANSFRSESASYDTQRNLSNIAQHPDAQAWQNQPQTQLYQGLPGLHHSEVELDADTSLVHFPNIRHATQRKPAQASLKQSIHWSGSAQEYAHDKQLQHTHQHTLSSWQDNAAHHSGFAPQVAPAPAEWQQQQAAEVSFLHLQILYAMMLMPSKL